MKYARDMPIKAKQPELQNAQANKQIITQQSSESNLGLRTSLSTANLKRTVNCMHILELIN